MGRRNLVILRAGDTSLHEQWLEGGTERNWDLIVNYFGDNARRYRQDDVRRINSKGPKWPALHDLIRQLGDEVFSYERVWLPDDDLRASKDGINALFDIFGKHRLALAHDARQPSRSSDHAAQPLVPPALHQFRRDHGAVLQPRFPQRNAADVQREPVRLGLGLFVAEPDRRLDAHRHHRRRQRLSHAAGRRPQLSASAQRRNRSAAGDGGIAGQIWSGARAAIRAAPSTGRSGGFAPTTPPPAI